VAAHLKNFAAFAASAFIGYFFAIFEAFAFNRDI